MYAEVLYCLYKSLVYVQKVYYFCIKNNRLFVNMISTLVSTFCLGNLVRNVAIGGIFVYAIDLYLILGLVLMVDTAIIYVNKR